MKKRKTGGFHKEEAGRGKLKLKTEGELLPEEGVKERERSNEGVLRNTPHIRECVSVLTFSLPGVK